MKTVLGLSMTSTSLAWVLLDGTTADAATLDHDYFAFSASGGDISRSAAAVRSAQTIAAASGNDITSIHVTWSDDAVFSAAALLKALRDMGFGGVRAVRLSEAAAAWAQASHKPLDPSADEAQLALARGAALVVTPPELPPSPAPPGGRARRSRYGPLVRAAALLVGGLIALFAIGPEFAGHHEPVWTAADNASTASASVQVVPLPVAPTFVAPPDTVVAVAHVEVIDEPVAVPVVHQAEAQPDAVTPDAPVLASEADPVAAAFTSIVGALP